ncbi:hypothetical protein [Burkholderia pyrrocinia]|uniref:hypothetical protein n=1 Tax=Burkholderia pyrrocinia TaxID=60550 RepID=UPI002AB1A457|nr:hypothetical protein [Burkholderia pyrrocinia]
MSRDMPFPPEAGRADPKHHGERFACAYGIAIEGPFASKAERVFEREPPAGRHGSPKRHGNRWARS